MSSPKVIALYSPLPQSGKSLFAKLAQEQDWIPIPFAKPLKDMLGTLLGNVYDAAMVHEFLYGSLKGYHLFDLGMRTPRELLQSLGTDWGRDTVDKGLWVYLWKAQVSKAIKAGQRIIVEDMRFPNELDAVYELGGFPIKITRPSAPPSNGHPSEGLLDGELFPMELLNTGTSEEFEQGVRTMLHELETQH